MKKNDKTKRVIWNFKDLLIFFILIPIINIIIFILPTALKKSLMLNLNSPAILNIFVSNYLHLTLSHWISNLVAYFIIIFLIFNLETSKKRLYYISLVGLLAIPFILFIGVKALFNLFRIGFPPTLGFSGIVCFFLGYLLFVTYRYCKTHYYSELKYYLVYIILIFNVLLWLIFNNSINKNAIYLLIVAVVLEITLIISNFKGLKEVSRGILFELSSRSGQRKINWYKFVIFILVMAFNLSLITIVPKVVIVNDSIINTIAHFLGYLLGVFIPFVFLWREK